ncbi:MAG: hypothetical protein MUE85_00545 [Microscillaceae bacterium]|jgi:hypothetical protein|nr:hypothetical protein [Microscillaceae bacterium]
MRFFILIFISFFKWKWVVLFLNTSILFAQNPSEQKASIADSLENRLPSIADLVKKNGGLRFLALEKRGAIKRIRYFAGDEIEFKVKNDPFLYRPIIQSVLDSALLINGVKVDFKDISTIKVYKDKPFLRLLSNFAFYGSVGYLLIDLVNNSFTFYRGTLITSAAFAVPGLSFALILKPRMLRLNRHRYLKSLQMY